MILIITYWEMCTGWNVFWDHHFTSFIITYWEMCTGWNHSSVFVH